MENSVWTTFGAAVAGIGAGAYGMYRKVLADMRHDKVATLHDDAIDHLITNLREEVQRLSQRLAAVEEQNRKCEEDNHALREEIISMKKQLHLF
jgi:hypothetical protein